MENSHFCRCYLALGSNLNNPNRQLSKAIAYINHLSRTQYIRSANWYQSKPWGVTEQDDFINTVIEIQTTLTPMALLKAIKIIEYRLMQRQESKRWHARVIDIDILLYGQTYINRKQLIIPHPLIAERSFVWVPLLELNPILPVSLKKQLKFRLKYHFQQSQLKKINSNKCTIGE